MTPADYLEGRLAELKVQWEAGQFSAVIDAFRECAIGNYPVPEWLALVIDDELCHAFDARSTGRGRTGNRAAQEREAAKHRKRVQVFEYCLAWQADEVRRGVRECINEAQARREASVILRKTFAQGSANAIEDSVKLLRSGPEKGKN